MIATFNPIMDPDTGDRLVQFPLDDGTECPVEPVLTDVAIGEDGALYVSELTGTTAENIGGSPSQQGLAGIWHIEPGASGVICPSANCTKVVTGLNSVIDLEFGPDGYLYLVEFDTNGWFASAVSDNFGLGNVKKMRCIRRGL